MTAPAVSVVMIFLDAAEFMDEALRSMRHQTLADWELLLVDDGSTDGSAELAGAAADGDERIRVLRHDDGANHGMSASRNLALAAAEAPLVSFLDADDTYEPDRLAHHVRILETVPSAGMVYGPRTLWYSWDDESPHRDLVYPTYQPTDELLRPPRLFEDWLLGWSPTPATCSVTIRRRALEEVGGFDDSFPGMFEDQVAFLKLALHVDVVVTDRPLDRYRQHAGSTSARALETGQWSQDDPTNPAQRALQRWVGAHLTANPHPLRARLAYRRLQARARCSTIPVVGPLVGRLQRRSRRRRHRRMRVAAAAQTEQR